MMDKTGFVSFWKKRVGYLVVGLFLLHGASPEWCAAQGVGVVRFMEVVEAHPRMQAFSPDLKRFPGGYLSDKEVEAVQREIAQLQVRLQELGQAEAANVQNLQTALNNPKAEKKKAQEAYWSAREKAQAEREKILDRISQLSSRIEFGGKTPEIVNLPEIKQILSDVYGAILAAARQRGLTLLFNEPIPPPPQDEIMSSSEPIEFPRDLTENGQNNIKAFLSQRLAIAGRLARHLNLSRPILGQIIDITPEAIQYLRRTILTPGGPK